MKCFINFKPDTRLLSFDIKPGETKLSEGFCFLKNLGLS